MRKLLALVGLAFVGCTTANFQHASNGPVDVFLMPDIRAVDTACAGIYGELPPWQMYRGCTVSERITEAYKYAKPYQGQQLHYAIFCSDGDVECITHEIRHLLFPEWRHEK